MKIVVRWSARPIGTIAFKRAGLGFRVLVMISTITITITSRAGLVAIPAASPDTGAAMADALRNVVRPEPVSALESVAFQMQVMFNRALCQVTGKAQDVTWARAAEPARERTPAPNLPKPTTHSAQSAMPAQNIEATTKPQPAMSIVAATVAVAASIASDVQTSRQIEEASVVGALPVLNGGWQAFGANATTSRPIMARGIVQPDPSRPSRPFVRIAVIRIDLHQAQLHLVAGTKELTFARAVPPFTQPGFITYTDISPDTLLAAFNSYLKAEHGRYGMMVDGLIILPPLDGIATVGLYPDGHIQIGAWDQGGSLIQDLVAFRQNCALLVQQGQVRPNIDNTDLLPWGITGKGNPSVTSWSGLGHSHDGRFLISVVGQSLTAQTLVVALQQAGAYYGMQLDINGGYARFVTYKASDAAHNAFPMQAEMLLNDMRSNTLQFLAPYKHGFFYITASPR